MEQQGWLSKEKVRLPFIFHQGWGILKTFTFRDWFFSSSKSTRVAFLFGQSRKTLSSLTPNETPESLYQPDNLNLYYNYLFNSRIWTIMTEFERNICNPTLQLPTLFLMGLIAFIFILNKIFVEFEGIGC